MQALFYMDMEKRFSGEMFSAFMESFVDPDSSDPEDMIVFSDYENVVSFSRLLVSGVIEKKDEIDALLKEFSSHWKISRMSGVDRNAMRIAIYEIKYTDVPKAVPINEAIDIGKKYGSRDSGGFINGILDAVKNHLEKNVSPEQAQQNPDFKE